MGKRDKQILLGIALVALLMAGVLFFMEKNSGPNSTALISIDGKQVMEIPLSSSPDQTIDLSKFGVSVVLEVSNHQIRFLSSDCPDQVCIRFGLIDHEPQSAVCMPNRVAITIISK